MCLYEYNFLSLFNFLSFGLKFFFLFFVTYIFTLNTQITLFRSEFSRFPFIFFCLVSFFVFCLSFRLHSFIYLSSVLLFLYLYLCFSISISLYLSFSLFFSSISTSVYLLFLYLSLSLSVSLCLSLSLSVSLSLSFTFSTPHGLYVFSTYRFFYLSVFLLSVFLSVCLAVSKHNIACLKIKRSK